MSRDSTEWVHLNAHHVWVQCNECSSLYACTTIATASCRCEEISRFIGLFGNTITTLNLSYYRFQSHRNSRDLSVTRETTNNLLSWLCLMRYTPTYNMLPTRQMPADQACHAVLTGDISSIEKQQRYIMWPHSLPGICTGRLNLSAYFDLWID